MKLRVPWTCWIPLVAFLRTGLAADTTPPATPASVHAVETSETQAVIAWAPSTDDVAVAGYRVFRDGALLGTSANTNLADAGPLDRYRSYEYSVAAYDAAGNTSAPSPAAVFAYRRFPFSIPWDDAETNSVANMSFLSAGPADARVVATNGHLQAGGAPIRFLGVSLTYGAGFPDHATADALAARFAKLGINCVRFHNMDSTTASRGIFLKVPTTDPSYLRALDPDQMDKLDYFIARLKAQGIYCDLGLHTSRSYPGFPTGGVPKSFKGVDQIVPGLVDLQKEHAGNLLTHVNAYTGNAYADEPAVAFVEINNEDGLIDQWMGGAFGPDLDATYRDELAARWNDWLAARHADTPSLEGAWAPASGSSYGVECLTNGDFATAFSPPWTFEVTAPAAASAQVVAGGAPDGSNALRIDVNAASPTNDDVRCHQGGFQVSSGQAYTVRFKARSREPRTMLLALRDGAPSHDVLAAAQVSLSTNWQSHTVVLDPGGATTSARFILGGLAAQTGGIWFAGVSLQTGDTLLGPASASAEGSLAPELLANADLSSGFVSPWVFQVTAPAVATQTVVAGGAPDGANMLQIGIASTGTANWHVQYHHRNLQVTNGYPYTVTFQARADASRELRLALSRQNSPFTTFASASVSLTTNWASYTIQLTPNATEDAARLTIGGMGLQTGAVWIAHHSLRSGAPGIGLPAGEALGTATIIDHPAALDVRTRAVRRDWMRFLWDTESAYWDDMRDYLRTTLGVKSLLIGTQTTYSPSLLQARFDIVDCHMYWKHPTYTKETEHLDNYYIENAPMTGSASNSTIVLRADGRVSDKPFVCTEFNHPAPSTFGADSLPLTAAYAALQQWDAIFPFQYVSDTEWSQGHYDHFFTLGREPAKLISFPFAAAAMRRGDVAPAAGEAGAVVSVDAALDRIAETDVLLGAADFGVDPPLALNRRLSIATGAVVQTRAPWPDPATDVMTADTGELLWNTTQGVVAVRAPLAKALVGDAGMRTFDLGDGVMVTPGDTMQGDGWCAITLTAMAGGGFANPGARILLTAAGYADNHRMVWNPGMGPTHETSMVASTNWGTAPTLMEGIPATIALPRPAPLVNAWALDGRGVRKTAVPVTAGAGGEAVLAIGRAYETAWYEIENLADLAIVTASPLPTGTVAAAYGQHLAAAGATAPYTWSLIGGALPDGLALDSDGRIEGFPSSTGTFSLAVQTVDAVGVAATQAFEVAVGGTAYDFWRRDHFTPSELADSDISGPDADPDGDRQPNAKEFPAGTDPHDPESCLKIASLEAVPVPAAFVVQWPSVSGRTYRIEYGATVAGPWNADLPGSLRPAPDMPGILSYTDDTSFAPSPRIYRIRLIPPD